MSAALSMFEQSVLPLFEATRAAWLADARAVAWQLGEGGRPVCVDDVRRLCPPPQDADPRVMGAIMYRPAWVRVGDRNSGRKTCHKRRVSMFVRAEFVGE